MSNKALCQKIYLCRRLRAAAENGHERDSASLVAAADSAIADETARIAAEARRTAVLKGLASLGYEVREGLKTELAANRQVIVNNPATPGFGVEIVAPQTSSRCQMRVVAIGPQSEGRDTSRDRDIETQWCGNLDKLREFFAAHGSDLEIERATDPGTVPLKVVEQTDSKIEHIQEPSVTVHRRAR